MIVYNFNQHTKTAIIYAIRRLSRFALLDSALRFRIRLLGRLEARICIHHREV